METRPSPRSSRILLTSEGQVIGRRGLPLKGSPGTGGYLRVSYYTDDGRKTTSAVHVLVCEAFHGPRPDSMVARHSNGDKLDNRPENVVWGTPAQNYADRDAHGATARGERQHLAKLTDEKVLQIRRLLAAGGQTLQEIGDQFGVEGATVGQIAHRRTWTHVPDEHPGWVYRAEHGKDAKGESNGNSRLTGQKVREIRARLDAGVSQRKIAKEFGISQGLVWKIKVGATWAHIP